MSKLRMEKRKKVMVFTPVYDLKGNVALGYLADLTLKGALLVSEQPIETDRTMTVAIEFRKASEKPTKRMTIPARVAWCRLEEHRTYYNTGLEFVEPTAQHKKAIEAALKTHEFSTAMPEGAKSLR